MTAEPDRCLDNSDDRAAELIETARWHVVRYDGLRASLASRASLVVSVDAVVIAGVSFLFPWIVGQGIFGGTASLTLVGLGTLLTLIFATLSVRSASRALLSSKSWRCLFGNEAPPSLFYQHSDTIKAVPGFTDFRAAFVGQTRAAEAEAAMVNLWLVLLTHAHRYRHLRVATKHLQVATLAFAGSAVAALVLGLLGRLAGRT